MAKKENNDYKNFLMCELLKELSLSLKKAKRFGDFTHSYKPFYDKYINDDEALYNLLYYPLRKDTFRIGDKKFMLHVRPFWRILADKFTLVDKIAIVSTMLKENDGKTTYPSITNSEVLEAYVTHEVSKLDKSKIYANELEYSFLFGLVFAIIAFLLITSLLALVFTSTIALEFSLVILVILLVLKFDLNYFF